MKPIFPFKKLRVVLFVVFLGLGTTAMHAQIGFYTNVDDGPPAAPIDGLVTVTLLAGAFLGVRKLQGQKKA